MRIKSILHLLVCFLLSRLTVPSIACECNPACTGCQSCEAGVCVDRDYFCPPCQYCYMGECMPYGDCGGGCPACESCVSCWCQCTSECCENSDCTGACHNGCSGCSCVNDNTKCSTCKECVGGNCVLKSTSDCDVDSDCDPSQHCENCKCVCDTCWTTSTTPASIQAVCEDCVNIAWDHCPGEYEETIEHERCSPASTGVSGRCECHETTGITGYTYECKVYPNWNWCLCPLLWEACEAVCGSCPMEPTPILEGACAACLVEYLHECITPCSYVDKCDKDDDDKVPKYGPKFDHFGGGTCTG